MESWAAFETTTTRPSALEVAACSDSRCDGDDGFVAVVISFSILFDSIFASHFVLYLLYI